MEIISNVIKYIEEKRWLWHGHVIMDCNYDGLEPNWWKEKMTKEIETINLRDGE